MLAMHRLAIVSKLVAGWNCGKSRIRALRLAASGKRYRYSLKIEFVASYDCHFVPAMVERRNHASRPDASGRRRLVQTATTNSTTHATARLEIMVCRDANVDESPWVLGLDYHFTTPAERDKKGCWWRETINEFTCSRFL